MNTEPNKPSATPETDGVTLKAQPGGMVFYDTVPAEFARRLERERDEERLLNEVLQANLKDIRQGQDKEQNVCVDLMRERDEAKAENDSLRTEVESLRAALTEQSAAAENEKLHAAVQAKFCGNDILDAIVRSDSIENVIIENGTFIIIWKANAAEQIEAALEEVTNGCIQQPRTKELAMSDDVDEGSAAMLGSLAWIPVTERLPPVGEKVLYTCLMVGDGPEDYFTDVNAGYWDGKTKNLPGDPAMKYDDSNDWEPCSHWMPLPAPPTDAK